MQMCGCVNRFFPGAKPRASLVTVGKALLRDKIESRITQLNKCAEQSALTYTRQAHRIIVKRHRQVEMLGRRLSNCSAKLEHLAENGAPARSSTGSAATDCASCAAPPPEVERSKPVANCWLPVAPSVKAVLPESSKPVVTTPEVRKARKMFVESQRQVRRASTSTPLLNTRGGKVDWQGVLRGRCADVECAGEQMKKIGDYITEIIVVMTDAIGAAEHGGRLELR